MIRIGASFGALALATPVGQTDAPEVPNEDDRLERDHRRFPPMIARPTFCPFVSGIGPVCNCPKFKKGL
jgi:hypothetical protein